MGGATRCPARAAVCDVAHSVGLTTIDSFVVVAIRVAIDARSRANSSNALRDRVVARTSDTTCTAVVCTQ